MSEVVEQVHAGIFKAENYTRPAIVPSRAV